MSWYSKAWGSTKDWSAGRHWGYSAGAGGAGGALLGAGVGYGFGGGEGSAWGAGIGALGGAAGGYGFRRYAGNRLTGPKVPRATAMADIEAMY